MTKHRLAEPFAHIEVEYPYYWPGIRDGLHVQNDKTGEGTVYGSAFAGALATGILVALDGESHDSGSAS